MHKRTSRDTRNNRQVWSWSIKWSRAKANRVLPSECTDHSKYFLPITQETTLHMAITRWSVPKSDWLYSLKLKWKSSIQSPKPTVITHLNSTMIKYSHSNCSTCSFHFSFLEMVLITASCTMSWTFVHSSSGTLSIRSNPLNLFLTSTV